VRVIPSSLIHSVEMTRAPDFSGTLVVGNANALRRMTIEKGLYIEFDRWA
jgi:hypothetical protein